MKENFREIFNSSVAKGINYRAVCIYIYENGPSTAPQISKNIGLSLPTVCHAVEFGVNMGLLVPGEMLGAECGRKAQLYKVNTDHMHSMLIYLDSDTVSYMTADFVFGTVKNGSVPAENENVLSVLDDLIEASIAEDPLIKMAAVAVSGVVCKGAVVESKSFPSLKGVNIVEHISEKFGVSVVADNDFHAVAHVALNYSDCEDSTALFYAYGKRNSGFAIIADGNVLCGASGAAGELEDISLCVLGSDTERIEFCGEQLSILISLMNPNKVIIYELNDGLDTERLISLTKEKVTPYLLPEFKLRKTFFEDCFLGLKAMLKIKVNRDILSQVK